MNTPPGWYPDPSGDAPTRYWDGALWTGATAGLAPVIHVPVPIAVATRTSFAQRHPVWTAFGVLWGLIMVAQFPWLGPTLLAVGALTLGFRWLRREARKEARHEAGLRADAELQNQLHLQGDLRGVYGDFPPPRID